MSETLRCWDDLQLRYLQLILFSTNFTFWQAAISNNPGDQCLNSWPASGSASIGVKGLVEDVDAANSIAWLALPNVENSHGGHHTALPHLYWTWACWMQWHCLIAETGHAWDTGDRAFFIQLMLLSLRLLFSNCQDCCVDTSVLCLKIAWLLNSMGSHHQNADMMLLWQGLVANHNCRFTRAGACTVCLLQHWASPQPVGL